MTSQSSAVIAQGGALWRYDLASSTMKPWNVTIQTIEYMDHNGNPQTKQVIYPP